MILKVLKSVRFKQAGNDSTELMLFLFSSTALDCMDREAVDTLDLAINVIDQTTENAGQNTSTSMSNIIESKFKFTWH